MDPVPTESTHPGLLSRVRDPKDEDAWREFDARYRSLIQRYCRARQLQPAEADDVRQLVMMALARYLRAFHYRPELGRFRDYLRRTVDNAIRHYLASQDRKAVRLLEEDALAELGPREDGGFEILWEEEWVRHHYRRALAAARKETSDQSADVFEELLAGRTPAEVAERHAMKLDAVYQVKHRMRLRLQAMIEQQIRDEEFPERSKSNPA